MNGRNDSNHYLFKHLFFRGLRYRSSCSWRQGNAKPGPRQGAPLKRAVSPPSLSRLMCDALCWGSLPDRGGHCLAAGKDYRRLSLASTPSVAHIPFASETHQHDLLEVFQRLRHHGLIIRPEKCILGAPKNGHVVENLALRCNLVLEVLESCYFYSSPK